MRSYIPKLSPTTLLVIAVRMEIYDRKGLREICVIELCCVIVGQIVQRAPQQLFNDYNNLRSSELTCQDAVTFTGSASTGRKLKQHPNVVNQSVRFTMEADSLNCSILGMDAHPGSDEFDLYIREVAREMMAKSGQKCTAIRRAIAPRDRIDTVIAALSARLDKAVIGNPTTLLGTQNRERTEQTAQRHPAQSQTGLARHLDG